ncbi:MAG: outer membrane lipoprotein carrier protein LolA [Bacteroidales bacterium]|nr:outer membrane lipoprotein carrier protein LolA [Bacteroidales bacterium]
MALPFFAVAQITHTAQGELDKNAQEVLGKAEKKFNGGPVRFTVNMLAKDSQKKQMARHTAQIEYHGGKYRASFDGQTVICDGKTVYTLDEKSKEVVINALSEKDDDLTNPANLLVNWQKGFRAKYIRTESNGDAVVDMTPKKGKSYYKIRIIIGSGGTLKRMVIHNYDGSEVDFDVTDFKSTAANPSTFTFDKSRYAGYEEIDMR